MIESVPLPPTIEMPANAGMAARLTVIVPVAEFTAMPADRVKIVPPLTAVIVTVLALAL